MHIPTENCSDHICRITHVDKQITVELNVEIIAVALLSIVNSASDEERITEIILSEFFLFLNESSTYVFTEI